LLAVLEATEFVFVVVDLMKPRALMPHFWKLWKLGGRSQLQKTYIKSNC
jgi:hypothetical protein